MLLASGVEARDAVTGYEVQSNTHNKEFYLAQNVSGGVVEKLPRIVSFSPRQPSKVELSNSCARDTNV